MWIKKMPNIENLFDKNKKVESSIEKKLQQELNDDRIRTFLKINLLSIYRKSPPTISPKTKPSTLTLILIRNQLK